MSDAFSSRKGTDPCLSLETENRDTVFATFLHEAVVAVAVERSRAQGLRLQHENAAGNRAV